MGRFDKWVEDGNEKHTAWYEDATEEERQSNSAGKFILVLVIVVVVMFAKGNM